MTDVLSKVDQPVNDVSGATCLEASSLVDCLLQSALSSSYSHGAVVGNATFDMPFWLSFVAQMIVLWSCRVFRGPILNLLHARCERIKLAPDCSPDVIYILTFVCFAVLPPLPMLRLSPTFTSLMLFKILGRHVFIELFLTSAAFHERVDTRRKLFMSSSFS
jgi:hypothetical protein